MSRMKERKNGPKCMNCKYFTDEFALCNYNKELPVLASYERNIRRHEDACGKDGQHFKRIG